MRWIHISMCMALFLPLLLISCGTSGDAETMRRDLMEADRAFAAETAVRGLEGWLAWFDQDAAVFPRDRAVIRGIDQIRAFYVETGFDPAGLKWEPERAEISDDGTFGMTYGAWTMVDAADDGGSEIATGKYMTVWRKTPQGDWRVVADMGSTDAEPLPELEKEAGELFES